MNKQVDYLIKIALSVLMLLCLFNMPYGFYELVRFASLIGFSVLAYHANQRDEKTSVIVFIALALMFQPFLKIAFGRTLWNIIDVVVAVGLVISIYKAKKHDSINTN